MAKLVFDFSKLITNCLHNKKEKFTNSIEKGLINKNFFGELFRSFQTICQELEFEKLLTNEREHCHFVTSFYIKEKIEKLIDNKNIELKRLCQIPLGKVMRLYGNLKRINHSNFFFFEALLLDPNHLIYEGQKFSKLKNMACLFSEDNC